MTLLPTLLQGMKPKGGGEYAGPCPWCGGRDRFILWPGREPRARAYMCRKCGASGDAIQLVRELRGVGYREACELLGVESKGKKEVWHGHATKSARIGARATKQVLPGSSSLPGEKWRQRAASFLADCQRDIEERADALCAITGGRFITPDAARACGVGYNSEDRYELRTAWGLEPIPGKPMGGKLRLPRGIVIASRRRAGVVALTVRLPDDRAETDPKYWEVAGGGDAPFIAWSNEPGAPVVLVESALDAALVFSDSLGTVTGVGMQGATKRPDVATDDFIRTASVVIAAPDNDDAGKAAWAAWRRWYPQAVAYPAAGGYKDLGDAHSAVFQWPVPDGAMTVMEWLPEAIEYAQKNATARYNSKGSGAKVSFLLQGDRRAA